MFYRSVYLLVHCISGTLLLTHRYGIHFSPSVFCNTQNLHFRAVLLYTAATPHRFPRWSHSYRVLCKWLYGFLSKTMEQRGTERGSAGRSNLKTFSLVRKYKMKTKSRETWKQIGNRVLDSLSRCMMNKTIHRRRQANACHLVSPS